MTPTPIRSISRMNMSAIVAAKKQGPVEEMTQKAQRWKWRSEQKDRRKGVNVVSKLVTPPVSPDPDVRGHNEASILLLGAREFERYRAKACRTVEKLTVKRKVAKRRRRCVQKWYERAQK